MSRQFLLSLIKVILVFLFGCQDLKSPQPENSISNSTASTISPSNSQPKSENINQNNPIPPRKPSAADSKAASQYRQLGLQYRSQQRYPEALNAFSKSVELDPQNLSGRVIFGWTLHLAGKPTEAISQLQKTLDLDSNHVPALNALGIVYLVSGNLQAAVETHRKALKLKPDNEIAHYNLSLAYQRLSNYEQAIIHGKEATVLEPNNPHPWVALALVYWDKGDKKLAQQTYQKAISLDGRYGESRFLENLREAGFSSEQIQQVQQIRQSYSARQ